MKMLAINSEGMLWLSAVIGPLAGAAILGFIAGSALSGNPLRPRLGLACAVACLAAALVSFGLGVVRAGRLTSFSVLALVFAGYGGRAVSRAVPLIRSGARPLTHDEEHIRKLAREVYGDRITRASVRFDRGDAILDLTLHNHPLRSTNVNLSSLARKRSEGLSDAVLRTFLGFERPPPRTEQA